MTKIKMKRAILLFLKFFALYADDSKLRNKILWSNEYKKIKLNNVFTNAKKFWCTPHVQQVSVRKLRSMGAKKSTINRIMVDVYAPIILY